MDQMRPELDSVLQSLSLNGYSIFSLMDYILAPYNREDQRIIPLREGIERDTADICLLLHSHNPAGLEGVLNFGRAQCTCSSFGAGLTRRRVLSCVYSRESQTCSDDRHTPGQCLRGHIRLLSIPIQMGSKSTHEAMANISAHLPEMAKHHICIGTPS